MVCASTSPELDQIPNSPKNDSISLSNIDNMVRIIGGVDANISNYPFSVLVKITSSGNGGATCGGSIISSNWILTAGHCLVKLKERNWNSDKKRPINWGNNRTQEHRITNNEHIKPRKSDFDQRMDTFQDNPNYYITNPQNIGIYYGSSIKKKMKRMQVKNVIVHPGVDLHTFRNDVALLELENPIPFSKSVNSVKISLAYIPSEMPLTAVGWGVSKTSNREIPNSLRATSLLTGSQEICRKTRSSFIDNNGDVICCPSFEGRDTCFGDSGGPLIAYELAQEKNSTESGSEDVSEKVPCLLGITSYGDTTSPKPFTCADPEGLGFYTHAAHFIDFIANSTGLSVKDISTNNTLIPAQVNLSAGISIRFCFNFISFLLPLVIVFPNVF
ncbi:hypothetical protein BB559_001128 [Furculomyces boomerangus]|uniref:Peptidase S1 domain-containing protein n=1 Tax=Furculomyces boomerangus TaxID=61424 RepID=A0A2T9Z2Z2_9FUNG|nr:hypothetical protein BB559_001128 [Furculomyces boomerangus]